MAEAAAAAATAAAGGGKQRGGDDGGCVDSGGVDFGYTGVGCSELAFAGRRRLRLSVAVRFERASRRASAKPSSENRVAPSVRAVGGVEGDPA